MIVANDVVATQMAGPGIRCIELGRQLAATGRHEVTLVTIGATDLHEGSMTILPHPSSGAMMVAAANQDAILLEGISLTRYPELRSLKVPLIFDLYDPFPLALLEQEAHHPLAHQRSTGSAVLSVLNDMLTAGDYFICASELQRDLWLGALLGGGRINPDIWARDRSLRALVDVVPFGLPASRPPPRDPRRSLPVADFTAEDIVLVWGGGIYNWFDPLTLIQAMGTIEDARVKLVFMSTGHPNPSIPPRMWMPSRARNLAGQLGLTGRTVFFNEEWVPYNDRGKWLSVADAGVSTHFDHAEARYAYRTRMLDYLWAGLPIICTSGDYFADLVAERRLGWVVRPGDVAQLANAIRELASNPLEREVVSARVADTAVEMTWERVAGPLLHFCDNPTSAADSPRRDIRPEGRHAGPAERLRGARRLLERGIQELAEEGPGKAVHSTARWWRARRRGR